MHAAWRSGKDQGPQHSSIMPQALRSKTRVAANRGGIMSTFHETDPEVWQAIDAERRRQQDGLEMIASENYTSPAVLAAQGSVLTNKYAEGYPGRRYYGGCEHGDILERVAIGRVCKHVGGQHANAQPHPRAPAEQGG